jgi:hypothetical protein
MSFLNYALLLATQFFIVAPGLYLASSIRSFRNVPEYMLLAWSITFSSIIGYLVFWLYFLHPLAGRVSSWVVFALGIAAAVHFVLCAPLRARLISKEIAYPFAIMTLAVLSYISILYACPHTTYVGQANIRFLYGLPGDNVIPKNFADSLHAGLFPDIHTPGWRSSDRPPLQSGIYLMIFPLERFSNYSGFPYQVAGTVAQCFWIPALWALCRAIRLRTKAIAVTFFVSIFSGFFLINSVFVWPKLLSAALAAVALLVAIKPQPEGAAQSTLELCLASSAGALGMLSHAGVAFAYPAMALAALRHGFPGNFKRIALAMAVFVVWMIPWSAYQKYYDPPGNRLAKWHLAGAVEIDDRTFLQALRDGYAKLTFAQFAENKMENIKALAGPSPDLKSVLWPSRDDQFYYLARTLGLLNIGWLVLGVSVFRRKRDSEEKWASELRILGVFTIALWVLALFNPGSTIVPGGSYAMVLFLFVGLAILIAQLPGWVILPFLVAHFSNFAVMWIFSSSPEGSPMNPKMLGVAIACWIGIACVLCDVIRSKPAEADAIKPASS